MHWVCREEIFCHEQAYQSLSYVRKGGGLNFQLCPLLGPPGILSGPNWHMHNLAMGPTIQDHNWVSMVFSCRGDAITRFT